MDENVSAKFTPRYKALLLPLRPAWKANTKRVEQNLLRVDPVGGSASCADSRFRLAIFGFDLGSIGLGYPTKLCRVIWVKSKAHWQALNYGIEPANEP